jgi:predicted transcriptional regulator
MEALDLRESVLDYIKNKADNKFLRLVNAMATTYQEDMERISLEQYNKEIDESMAQIEKGQTYTHEEMGERIKKWAKK